SNVTSYAPPPPADVRSFPGSRPEPDPVSSTQGFDRFPYGEWFGLKLTLGPVNVLPSVRAEQDRVVGHWLTAIDPRLIVRHTLFSVERSPVLKGSVGLYHQSPGPGLFDPIRGNPNLGMEAAFQAALGVEQKITRELNVDATAFYARRYDLAVRAN